MDRFFSMDNKFFTFMGKVADLFILNILCLICCIPIVTAGASITAMFYVTMKMVKNEESYIIKSFFKSFKQNFKQATALWLIILAACGVLYADYRIIAYSGLAFDRWIKLGLVTVTLIIALGTSFVFAMQARFYNTVKHTLKNAFLMALSHLPSALLFVVSYAVPLVLLYFFPQILPVIVLLAIGLMIYLKSFLFLRIFKKYEDALAPKEEEEFDIGSEDSGIFAGSESMEQMSENKASKK